MGAAGVGWVRVEVTGGTKTLSLCTSGVDRTGASCMAVSQPGRPTPLPLETSDSSSCRAVCLSSEIVKQIRVVQSKKGQVGVGGARSRPVHLEGRERLQRDGRGLGGELGGGGDCARVDTVAVMVSVCTQGGVLSPSATMIRSRT